MKKIISLFIFLIISQLSYSQNNDCGGIERWDVKVLADSEAVDIEKNITNTTITDLRNQNVKRKKGDKTRQGIEFKKFRVVCNIKFFKLEKDNDYHVVITESRKPSITMVAEVPDPDCEDAKNSGFAENYRKVRKFIEDRFTHTIPKTRLKKVQDLDYVITGIGFMDFFHRQTGMAPNNLEIHPILEIKELNN